MKRLCIEAGCSNTTTGTRCSFHESQRQAIRNAGRPHLRGDWGRVSAKILAEWRAEYGNWCPGYKCSPHEATDLTVDHVEARSVDVLAVLCRSCNSRKGAR